VNYRHHYHAGGAADVFKHALLVLQLAHLTRKSKGLLVLDSHAGAGRYDLEGPAARKTGEWRLGIGRLWAEPRPHPSLVPYLEAVGRATAGHRQGRCYVGSALLIAACLRPQDRLICAERQPQDAAELARLMAGRANVRVLASDGYAALKAHLPPPERRGLVLIDPPYETEAEAERAVKALSAAHRRFATGGYFLWYPIKARAEADRLLAQVKATGIRRVLVAEVLPFAEPRPFRLNGSGLVMVNPAHGLAETLRDLLPWLARRLAREGEGGCRVAWLVGE